MSELNEQLKTWPAEIWLQHGADEIPAYDEVCGSTWCEDNINENDVRYVRADLATPVPQAAPSEPVAKLWSVSQSGDMAVITDGAGNLITTMYTKYAREVVEAHNADISSLKSVQPTVQRIKSFELVDCGTCGSQVTVPVEMCTAPSSPQQAQADARDAALEEAAKLCDGLRVKVETWRPYSGEQEARNEALEEAAADIRAAATTSTVGR